ncbi:MAG: transcription-repair coupling factor [Firmicutes bacterium]|nr:transcription-repair coupling factor [Bacillota bacterium]
MNDPVRIELFDDEIDSIRSFDSFTQRSIENLTGVCINRTVLDTEEEASGSILDYLGEGSLVIRSEKDLPGVLLRSAPVYAGHMDMLSEDLKKYIKEGYDVTVACSTADRLVNLRDFLGREGLDRVKLVDSVLSSGAEIPEEKILYISENDIFPSAKYSRRRRTRRGVPIKAFTDIQPGDYVVHEIHGIGQFTGVVKMTVDGSTRDYLKIQYAGKDVLYVPVDQMENIQKYMGSDSVAPRISKLSGSEWQTIKSRAKASIREMAEEFLKNAAKRAAAPGFAFEPDSTWQKEFEDSFPYVETEDQLRCVEEIKKDMESPKSMDRLLCGDVGYGKTEVAARAIFKCLEQGKQAAVLVPTTVLANQHYHTFLSRFAGYPFAIDMLSRFKDEKERKAIVDKLAKGDIDLIVGTHRLLSKDVKFKDLGLLVVDEEQRFGVEHKEVIKKLKENVDVLTLSATPIPRTLHMSLIGVRDMSVIEQPPEDRYPVQTYVMEQDDDAIRAAIRRELARGGQVYVVYNRVRGIQGAARQIHEIVPEATIAIGHGQMNERELEDVMMGFAAGETQVLISTTIIESGLDIPNVNTLIVMDADKFGLSQLYQLRGRVGRSNRMAYAYLFVKKDKVISETAEKRLKAIKEFTEFGSGFKVAMRDLELRGAGNILGVEQSGHMLSIGYELYCKLVEEAVEELTGQAPEDKPLEADTQIELGVSAYLPENYVSDEITRLEMYKKISSIASDEDREEIVDELLDRFGDVPGTADNLLDIAYLRNLASKCGISRVAKQQDKAVFLFEEKSLMDAEHMALLMDEFGPRLTIYGGSVPRIAFHLKGGTAQKECLKFVKCMLSVK